MFLNHNNMAVSVGCLNVVYTDPGIIHKHVKLVEFVASTRKYSPSQRNIRN